MGVILTVDVHVSCGFIATAVKMFIEHGIWKLLSYEMWPVNPRRAMNAHCE